VTQTNPPKTATPTGFDTIEKLLGEFRDRGRSVTLETWNKEFAARLEAFRAANTNPVLLKQAAQIEKAFSTANKLVETIKPAKSAAKPPTLF
jgi:hypothetical protein